MSTATHSTHPGQIRGTIGIGIVGAGGEGSWSARAHVPALATLPGLHITAVSTTRPESAREAALVTGAEHAFTDARALAEHPDVDLVVVSVKVPAHLELVSAAIDAGKHVLCEWPLARTTEEAEQLAAAADGAGVLHTLGLQARYSPAVRRARQLIADGYLGELHSATVHSARGKGRSASVSPRSVYTLDVRNAAGLLEVAGGHTLDVLQHLVGGITELSASLDLRRGSYQVIGSGEVVTVTSPDQLLLNATLTGGAVASVHLREGRTGEPDTVLDLAGSEGSLTLRSDGPYASYGVQIGDLRLFGARGDEPLAELPVVDERGYHELPAVVGNVAGLYAAIEDDLRTGRRDTVDFHHGVALHRLLDVIRGSADSGRRLRAA